MLNVLNTKSIGGIRCGRHWQSGDETPSGLSGEIIGFHNYDNFSDVYFNSYLIPPDILPVSAAINDVGGVSYTGSVTVSAQFDDTYKCFKNIVTVIFDTQYIPNSGPQTGYTKIILTLYRFPVRYSEYQTSYRYYTFHYNDYIYYDSDFHDYNAVATKQQGQVYTYDSYVDLTNDNYNNYYPVCGFDTWEVSGLKIPFYFDYVGPNNYQILNRKRGTDYGGTYRKVFTYGSVSDPRSISIGHLWGLQSDTATESKGYIKYRNGIEKELRIFDNVGTTYTDEVFIIADVFSRGEKSASDTTIITTSDTGLIIPKNTVRGFIY